MNRNQIDTAATEAHLDALEAQCIGLIQRARKSRYAHKLLMASTKFLGTLINGTVKQGGTTASGSRYKGGRTAFANRNQPVSFDLLGGED